MNPRVEVRPGRSRCRALTLFAALSASLSAVGCGSDGSSPSAERTSPDPEASTFVIEGGTVSMPCEGEGTIPVVLLAGGTDPHPVWDDLVSALGPDVLSCRFDAPGVGDSDPPDGPVTASARADALDATLTSAGLDGPVVLVAHSLGGQTARQFGSLHPERLAGAVLLDPTTRLAMLGLQDQLAAEGWDAEAASAEAEATVRWPDVPLIVLSHDPDLGEMGPSVVEQLWADGQAEYATLSAEARHEVVTGSGHYVYRDATPVVVAAILDVLTDAGAPAAG